MTYAEERDRYIAAAKNAVYYLAQRFPELTTDEVHSAGIEREYSVEPRILGTAMLQAKKAGYVTPTEAFISSNRPECHGRPVRVWRSNICRAVTIRNAA